MKTLNRAFAVAAIAVTAVIAPLTAGAAGVSVFLNLSNNSSAFPPENNYLQVTIADGIDGAIDFTVQSTSALSSIADSNFGIQSFSLNVGDTGATGNNLVLPDGWTVKKGNGSHSVFGKFDLEIQGTGQSRLDPLTFSIVGIDGDAPADYLTRLYEGSLISSGFAAHVAGFSLTGQNGQRQLTSAQFGGNAPVPLPASAWFMLSGIGILVLRAKLAKRKESRQERDANHARDLDMGLPA